jgi:predicted HTH domain antitoxin
MSITLPDELVQAAQMNESELMLEIIIMLFQQERITLGKAAQLAGMHQIEFQKLLASRKICIHYDVEDLEQDIETLKARGWL